MQIGYGMDENVLHLEDDKLYRHIPLHPRKERWDTTLAFVQSEAFAELQRLHYVPQHTFTRSTATHHVYEVEQCWPLIRCDVALMRSLPDYPIDEMLMEQALSILELGCKINRALIAYDSDVIVTELHPWNFTLQKGQPILLDVGAFSHPEPTIIKECVRMTAARFGFEQLHDFCRSDSPFTPITEDDWYKLSEVIQATAVQYEKSAWQDYTHAEQSEEVTRVSQLIQKIQPSTLLDIGGGDGLFSSIVAPNSHIICIDNCRPALNRGYRSQFKSTDFACVNVCTPYKHTTSDIELTASWAQRYRCDTLFASSIVHHLLQKLSLESIAVLFDDLARRYMLIEFIAHTDPYVTWYGPETNFEKMKAALPNWKVIDEVANYEIEPNRKHRIWYLLERQQMTKPNVISSVSASAPSALLNTRHLYDAKYYLTGCEGFSCSVDVLSPRLQSVYNAALPYLKGIVLDAGCGRGELTIRAARLDAVRQVHSIDYSPDAIKLLLDSLSKEKTTTIDKIHVHMGTVDLFLSYTNISYDCVLLSDVVEHIPFIAAQALIADLSLVTKTIIVSTPISQARPNERHLWLAGSEVDIQKMAPDFQVTNHGYAGSGEDFIFELTKI